MHAQQRELWPETAHLSLNPSYPGIFICCCTAIASLLWTLDHYITTQNKEKTPLHRQGEVFCATPANVARGFTSPSCHLFKGRMATDLVEAVVE